MLSSNSTQFHLNFFVMFYDQLSWSRKLAETWESPLGSLAWLWLILAQLPASDGSELEPRQH